MTFVTAWLAVAGAAAMAVPILIHLLMRRRRQPIAWGAMRLLRQAIEQQSRRLRIQHWIVLALRCLVLLLVGTAAAQPILRAAGVGERAGGRVVLLVIDDGVVAGLLREDRTALERHVAAATRLIDDLAPADAVGVIAAGRPARGLVLPPTTDHGAVSALLRTLGPADTATDLPAALELARDSIDRLEEGRPVAVYLLSDFRRGSAALETPLAPLLAELDGPERRVQLLALPAAEVPADNAQVAAIDPLRTLLLAGAADGSGQLTVRVARQGALAAATSRVSIAGEGIRPLAPRSLRWESGQAQASVEFSIEPLAETGPLGIVALLEPDLLPADNRRGAVLQSRRSVRVVLLERRGFGGDIAVERLGAGQWIARALQPDESSAIEISVEDPTRLAPRALRDADAVVVARPDLLAAEGWDAVRDLLARGGLAVVVPPEELNVHLWADAMVERLNMPWQVGIEPVEHDEGLLLDEAQPSTPLLRLLGGELPELVRPIRVFRRLPLEAAPGQAERLLVAADGSALAIAGPARDGEGNPLAGRVVLLAMAPELSWTDLPTKPLMVPLFQEIVRQGVGLGTQASGIVAGTRPLLPPAASELVPLQEGLSRVPAGEPVRRAGLYRVLDGAGQPLGLLAVDVDTGACDPSPQAADAVLGWLRGSGPWTAFDAADPGAPLRTVERGAPLALLLLVAALVAALLETFLARRFSYAERLNPSVLGGSSSPPAAGAGMGAAGVTA